MYKDRAMMLVCNLSLRALQPSLALALLVAASACSPETKNTPESVASDAGADSGREAIPRELITADWLNHSLSFLRLDDVLSGAERDAALIDTLDLSQYAQGPLAVQVTPDRKTALVTLSASFFVIPGSNILVNAPALPKDDPGRLLFVDLETRQVTGELETGTQPVGIAITSDGSRAFVAHFSSPHIAVVDVSARTLVEKVEVGPFSEEIVLDETSSAGIFAYSAAGNFRTFGVDDPSGKLSPEEARPGDSAGVAFFPGTHTAFVVEAPNVLNGDPSGYTVVDASDPAAPIVTEEVRYESADAVVQYPAAPAPKRGTVMVPVVQAGRHKLREYALSGGTVSVEREIDIAEASIFGALGVAVNGADHVICAFPRERLLSVTDLASETSFTIPWLPNAGPSSVVIR